MALAQLYSRTGDSKKSELMMTSLTGGSTRGPSNDFFAPALREDADPAPAVHEAEKNLNAISDQFESGEYDHLDANSFSAMAMVALSWAPDGLGAIPSRRQSGCLAIPGRRVGTEKTGAKDRARHMYALAAAAGGPEAQNSKQQVVKLGPVGAEKELSQATTELEKMRSSALTGLLSGSATARFILLFDHSTTPDRVQFLDGDDSLRSAAEKLQGMEFAVRFPDVSSIKIIRLGT